MTQIADHAAKMTRNRLLIAAAVLLSIAAFAAGPVLFPPSADLPTPSSGQLPFFVLLAGIEAAVLGVAVVFALRGRPAVRRLFTSERRAAVVHSAVVWTLGSWWVHDNLHLTNGGNLTGLLAIEYAFHVTLIAGAALIAWAFAAEARERRP